MILNLKYPVIRFEHRIHDLLFTAIILIIPVILLIQSFSIKNILAKSLSIIMLGLLSLCSLLFILMIVVNIGMISKEGYDPSFESLKAIQVDEYRVVAYRINGGAMTSYSMVVRQEKYFGFGLKIVKDLYMENHKGDVDLDWENHVLTIDTTKVYLKKNICY